MSENNNKQEFIITPDDFLETPEAANYRVPNKEIPTEYAADVAANEALFRRTFNVDDRIRFNMDGKIMGTGTVLGLGLDYIVKTYIILLDRPIQ